MPFTWSLSDRWEQLADRVQRAWATRAPRMTAQTALLGLTLALAVLSLGLGSVSLFLLAVVQGCVVLQLRGNRVQFDAREVSPAAAIRNGLREKLPTWRTGFDFGCRLATVAYRILYRVTLCLLVSFSAGLATLSAFVLKQAELWQWATLQTDGPPLGAVLVTGLAILTAFLIATWVASRWPLLPR